MEVNGSAALDFSTEPAPSMESPIIKVFNINCQLWFADFFDFIFYLDYSFCIKLK